MKKKTNGYESIVDEVCIQVRRFGRNINEKRHGSYKLHHFNRRLLHIFPRGNELTQRMQKLGGWK